MVGAVRFELTTSCTRNKRASQATLRPDPGQEKVPVDAAIGKQFVGSPGVITNLANPKSETRKPKFETNSKIEVKNEIFERTVLLFWNCAGTVFSGSADWESRLRLLRRWLQPGLRGLRAKLLR